MYGNWPNTVFNCCNSLFNCMKKQYLNACKGKIYSYVV